MWARIWLHGKITYNSQCARKCVRCLILNAGKWESQIKMSIKYVKLLCDTIRYVSLKTMKLSILRKIKVKVNKYMIKVNVKSKWNNVPSLTARTALTFCCVSSYSVYNQYGIPNAMQVFLHSVSCKPWLQWSFAVKATILRKIMHIHVLHVLEDEQVR